MSDGKPFNYGGFSGVELGVDCFELGHGVILKKTYAHIMSHQMMAFKPPPTPKSHHPAPWQAVNGGWSYDIYFEIFVPDDVPGLETARAEEILWFLAAIFRLNFYPFIEVRAVSNHSFNDIALKGQDTIIHPAEIRPRMIYRSKTEMPKLTIEMLETIKDNWIDTIQFIKSSELLASSFRAFDDATVVGNPSSSLLLLWGGLEQLFSPNKSELRFRVAINLASFLEPRGNERLNLYKKIQKLYGARCSAAHSASNIELGTLADTHRLMWQAIYTILKRRIIPDAKYLERIVLEDV